MRAWLIFNVGLSPTKVTIREDITRRKRKEAFIGYGGFGFFVLGGFATAAEQSFLPLALIGFAVFMASTVYLLFGIRCPRCTGRIGYTVSYPGSPFSVSQKIRYCSRGRCDFYGLLLDILSCLVIPAWMLQPSYIMSWPVESCGRPFFAMTRIAMTSSPVTRRELHP